MPAAVPRGLPPSPSARRRHRRWATPAALAALAVVAAVLAGCGGTRSAPGPATGAPATATAPGPGATPAARPTRPPPRPDPGSLPQTRVLPVAGGAHFDAGLRSLWTAVVTGRPERALPFFFPLPAYLQVKAIADPARDWRDRLVGLYGLDVRALHAALGPAAGRARLVGADVPTARARWIAPGAEYNKVGYYRVYGTRVRYTLDGRSRSFGICSMISWWGEWYAVHLGPVLRPARLGALCPPAG